MTFSPEDYDHKTLMMDLELLNYVSNFRYNLSLMFIINIFACFGTCTQLKMEPMGSLVYLTLTTQKITPLSFYPYVID